MVTIAKMTLWALFLGIAFGAFYDVIRISRVMLGVSYGAAKRSTEFLYSRKYPLIGMLIKKDSPFKERALNIIVALGDILFCLLTGAAFCIFLYYTNDGIFRWQALAAVFLGFFIYYKTIGVLVISFAEIICIFLKIITKIFLYAIAIPFKIMYNILVKVSKAVFGVPARLVLKRFRLVITDHKMKKLIADSADGFLEGFMKGQGTNNGLG